MNVLWETFSVSLAVKLETTHKSPTNQPNHPQTIHKLATQTHKLPTNQPNTEQTTH